MKLGIDESNSSLLLSMCVCVGGWGGSLERDAGEQITGDGYTPGQFAMHAFTSLDERAKRGKRRKESVLV